MTEKEIALALAFKEAPETVQKAAETLGKAYLRIKKADQQFALWDAERAEARRDSSRTMREFEKAISEWDPAQLKDGKIEEMKK